MTVSSADKGAEKGGATPGRGWPPHRQPIVMSGASSLVAVAACAPPQLLGSPNPWRRGSCPDGRRSVPPAECPTTRVAARMGREDPALVSQASPRRRPAGSLTPRMCVSVTCWGACGKCGPIPLTHPSISGQAAPRIEADAVPDSASLLPLGRPILPDARALLDAVNALALAGISLHETRGVQALIRSCTTCSLQPDARRSDQEFSGSDGAREGFPPSVGASRP